MDILPIKEQLNDSAEEKYRDFVSRLIPGEERIMGVRSPALRRLAKQIAKEDWQGFLAAADDSSHEMLLLQGMVIGYAKMELNQKISQIEQFLPKITNWAICDSFVTTLKISKTLPEPSGVISDICRVLLTPVRRFLYWTTTIDMAESMLLGIFIGGLVSLITVSSVLFA